MLKWTVTNKRNPTEKSEMRRHSTAGFFTATQELQNDRKEMRQKRRRSLTSRRSSITKTRKDSFCLEADKENRFTSTPIKSSDKNYQAVSFRDMSNITPKNGSNRDPFSDKKVKYEKRMLEREFSPVKPKQKKKRCLDPKHGHDILFSPTNYFQAFEAVDSNIEMPLVKDVKICPCKKLNAKTPTKEKRQNSSAKVNLLKPHNINPYAPTLPTFGVEYSPLQLASITSRVPPIFPNNGRFLHNNYPCYKKAKVDHVNDFLQQISLANSPEEEEAALFREDFKERLSAVKSRKEDGKITPLVKRLVDLTVSKTGCGNDKKEEHQINDDSSFINDLSLDKLVDAILENGSDDEEKSKENFRKGKEKYKNHIFTLYLHLLLNIFRTELEM